MLQVYLDNLTDDVYSRCKVTDTTIRLPVDPSTIPDEFTANQLDATLTPEKAISIAVDYLKSHKPVITPLDKLSKYYLVKRL